MHWSLLATKNCITQQNSYFISHHLYTVTWQWQFSHHWTTGSTVTELPWQCSLLHLILFKLVVILNTYQSKQEMVVCLLEAIKQGCFCYTSKSVHILCIIYFFHDILLWYSLPHPSLLQVWSSMFYMCRYSNLSTYTVCVEKNKNQHLTKLIKYYLLIHDQQAYKIKV